MDFADHFDRLGRAGDLKTQLDGDIQSWARSAPWDLESRIAEDRLSWSIVLRLYQDPPLGRWGHLFGESVHHLRASLDNMVVGVAKDTSVVNPVELKPVQFPISETRKAWKSDRSRIKVLPQEYQDAIYEVQPFRRSEAGGSAQTDPLLLLRKLDNQDKHYLQVKPILYVGSVGNSSSVEFESDAGAKDSVPPDIELSTSFRDGEVLLWHKTKGRIARVWGRYSLLGQVTVVLPDGNVVGVSEILSPLVLYIHNVMSYIMQVGA